MRGPGIFLLYAALLACSRRPVQNVNNVMLPAGPAIQVAQSGAPPASRPVLDALGDTIVGHTDIPLSKAQPESTLGNFTTDAMLAAGRRIDPGAEVAVCNYGGIRLAYVAPGAITRAQLRQIMPFDNTLSVVEVPGTILQDFCNLMARRKGWPVSGLSFRIREGLAVDVQIRSEPLSAARVYKVVVSNYLAKGGDECGFLSGLPVQRSRQRVRDALTDYLTKLESAKRYLHPALEGRVVYVE